MFEVAELGQKVDKATFEREQGRLRDALLDLQERVKEAKLPVVVVMGGVDGAGKGETVNTLLEWLDPRGVRVHAVGYPTDEEMARPPFYRFWRRLPPRGMTAIFLGSWYTAPIMERVHRRSKRRELEEQVADILQFERMLADDGACLIKFWMHLSRLEQKKRLKVLSRDPRTAWKVTEEDWENLRLYDRYARISEQVVRQTNTGHAPWHIIAGANPDYRRLTVANLALQQIDAALKVRASRPKSPKPVVPPLGEGERSVVNVLDYNLTIKKSDYDEELLHLQGRLNGYSRELRRQGRAAVIVFEGGDAAGKGGAIRRITQAMDARDYEVIPIAAPAGEEKSYPYMWRFWNKLPRRGKMSIFDRSWYGRVLVEVVEGFCTEDEWARAYAEINDFEHHLARHHTPVVKFWLAVTPEEQLRRFQEREQISFKRFKITPEDWRNREKQPQYDILVHRMVERTSTSVAPWTLVEANDKRHARIKTLRVLCDRLKNELS